MKKNQVSPKEETWFLSTGLIEMMPGAPLKIGSERAEEWRSHMESLRIPYGDHGLQATLSLGVASYPKHGTTSDALLRSADQALYAAKSAGRNRVVVCD